MTDLPALSATALAFALLGAIAGAETPASLPHFPTVSGNSLAGKSFRLPDDFEAPLNLVFIAYQRRQQEDVDSWKPLTDDVKRRFPQVHVYELPTLARGNALFRGFIDGGMRRGIPDPAVRAATITLYVDKGRFNAALGIASEDQITVLLVRPSGDVLWRTGGRYRPDLQEALDALLSATV